MPVLIPAFEAPNISRLVQLSTDALLMAWKTCLTAIEISSYPRHCGKMMVTRVWEKEWRKASDSRRSSYGWAGKGGKLYGYDTRGTGPCLRSQWPVSARLSPPHILLAFLPQYGLILHCTLACVTAADRISVKPSSLHLGSQIPRYVQGSSLHTNIWPPNRTEMNHVNWLDTKSCRYAPPEWGAALLSHHWW
ncbi:hypothetical protein ARMGADRAFT_1029975 [Armillaria gallica]|uniref:Uncharacterized protein n=1 Tax=Armillaria gallica TaxID=47427 RepID=A0A2H3DG16_ARMGA|nr:hypothetical protein ARMGADRAFT_1029975 [Armillaria gallica]